MKAFSLTDLNQRKICPCGNEEKIAVYVDFTDDLVNVLMANPMIFFNVKSVKAFLDFFDFHLSSKRSSPSASSSPSSKKVAVPSFSEIKSDFKFEISILNPLMVLMSYVGQSSKIFLLAMTIMTFDSSVNGCMNNAFLKLDETKIIDNFAIQLQQNYLMFLDE